MLKGVRFKLHFGPYRAPLFKYGAVVEDALLGEVTIVGLSAGRIPWPIGQKGKTKGPVLFKGLAKAVQKESGVAVQHWWGISVWRLWRWRKALGAKRTNEGTYRLQREYSKEPYFKRAQRKAVLKARDPVRREKIAASRRGKKRSAEVVRKMREANLGKKHSRETRRKMSEAHKRQWLSGPLAARRWTEAEEAWVRSLTIAEVVERTGRTRIAVISKRRKLGLPDGRRGCRKPMTMPGRWTPELDASLREMTAAEAVKKTGRSLSAVYTRRNQLGLNDGRKTNGRRPC